MLKKILKVVKYLFLFLVVSIIIFSFVFKEEIGTMYYMTNGKLAITTMSNGDKEIYFYEMAHSGRIEFYEKVRANIKKNKADSAILFYEVMKGTSLLSLTDSLKLIKIDGGLGTAESYTQIFREELGLDLIGQDNNSFLNIINSKDSNVDISAKNFVDIYEQKFGTIKLSELELKNKKIDTSLVNDKNINEIIMDYRTDYLAKAITAAKDKKIIVLYGAAHKDLLLQDLQKSDAKWKIISKVKN